MKNYPKIYNNDIKVLGRVVSIATENKVAAAEQIFDEKFTYNLASYSWDNIDETLVGMDQYTINRLFGKKLKKFDEVFQFDEDGWILELKVRNLIADNATINNKLTTKDLEVTNNAKIKNLHVTENSTFDGNVTIGGDLIVNNKNMGDLVEQVLNRIDGIDRNWKNSVDSDIANLKNRVSTLESCCEEVRDIINNLPTGAGDASFTVSPKSVELTTGETQQITVTKGADLDGTPTFTSGNNSVATVNSNGLITAVGAGETDITVKLTGFVPTQKVHVKVVNPDYSFEITSYPSQVKVGAVNQCAVTYNDASMTDYSGIVWTWIPADAITTNGSASGRTFNFTAAKSYQDVTVTASRGSDTDSITFTTYHVLTYMDGQTVLSTFDKVAGDDIDTITEPAKSGYTFSGWTNMPANGKMPNSDLTLTAQWTENEIPHTYSLSLDPTSINMTVGGETRGIIATRKRDNDVVISDGTINWTSSNGSIATVDNAGTVTAQAQGNATITATWVDPNGETKTATCSVTVSVDIVQPASLKIVGHENVTVDENTKVATIDVTDGSKTVKFKAVITPSNADTDTEITWTKLDGVGEITPDPNDSSICTYVSLDRSSICNLKATTANGMSDQILIDVVTTAPDPIYPSSIAISGPNEVQVGNTITLHATVSPSNADTDAEITWNSSNTSKATIDNGVVTGVAEGTTTITARTANGKTASHQVTVTAVSAPTEYSLTPSFDYWEFKLGTYPTSKTLTLTLDGWENGTQWDLKRSDNTSYNLHTSVGSNDQQISMADEADSPTGRQITFSAYIDNEKVGETTVTIVTLPADEPTHNTFTATFFDTGLGADETDPYVYGFNPNLDYPVGPDYYDHPVVLGTVEFTEGELSGVWHEAKEGWPTEEEVKAKCLAAGVDRSGYTLRWDSASYAGYMPNRDIYIKAVWDANQYTLTYKDGDTTVDTQTYYTGQTITPTTADGYQDVTWRDMPADMKMPAHDLTVYAAYPFTIEPTELSMIAGEHTHQMRARLNGSLTENVTWSSSNSSIVSVDTNGLATALAEGTAIITGTSTDNRALNNTATCSVTVDVRHPEIRTASGAIGTDEIALFVGESEEYQPTLIDVPVDCTLNWESDLIGTCYTLETIGNESMWGGTGKIRIKALQSTEGLGDLGNSSNPSIDVVNITLLDKDGNQVYDTNSLGQSYPVTAMLRVTINPDPIVTVEWDTDEHVTLSNTSSENGVEEFEPITLDENGDAVYHDWTASMNVDSGYKVKSATVQEFHGVSQINNTPDYRNWYGGKNITDDSITLTANGLKYTGPFNKIKITVTTEEV